MGCLIAEIIQFIRSCCRKYGYIDETFYLACVCFDSYLALRNIPHYKQLYLLGAFLLTYRHCQYYVIGKMVEELMEPNGVDLIQYAPAHFYLTIDDLLVSHF